MINGHFQTSTSFRGRTLKSLRWSPDAGINCLIGPGDSTKTTILDVIELCLNPSRTAVFAALPSAVL